MQRDSCPVYTQRPSFFGLTNPSHGKGKGVLELELPMDIKMPPWSGPQTYFLTLCNHPLTRFSRGPIRGFGSLFQPATLRIAHGSANPRQGAHFFLSVPLGKIAFSRSSLTQEGTIFNKANLLFGGALFRVLFKARDNTKRHCISRCLNSPLVPCKKLTVLQERLRVEDSSIHPWAYQGGAVQLDEGHILPRCSHMIPFNRSYVLPRAATDASQNETR